MAPRIAVEQFVATLNVVVANHTHVVAYEVAHVARFVLGAAVHEVEIVGGGLTLKDVPSVNQHRAARQLSHLLSNKAVHPLQTALTPAVMPEVVRKIVAVDV